MVNFISSLTERCADLLFTNITAQGHYNKMLIRRNYEHTSLHCTTKTTDLRVKAESQEFNVNIILPFVLYGNDTKFLAPKKNRRMFENSEFRRILISTLVLLKCLQM